MASATSRPVTPALAPIAIASCIAVCATLLIAVAPALTAQTSTPHTTGQPPADSTRKPLAGDSAIMRATESRVDSTAAGASDTTAIYPLAAVIADSGEHVYQLEPKASDDVRAAVDRTVAHMNFIARPIARRRLMRANRPPPRVTFAMRPDTIAVTFDGLNPIVTPRDGNAVPWIRGHTGEEYAVWMAESGDTLRQVIHNEDGQREDDFVFLDRGARVELHVVLTTDRLPMPLRYMLSFRRPIPVTIPTPAAPTLTPTQPATGSPGQSVP